MQQEIVVTDLTRMGNDTVCVAGINRSWEVIRPIARYGGIPECYLYKDGEAIIRPRSIIKLNVEQKTNCVAPHLEDYTWLNPEDTQFVRRADDSTWKNILSKTCFPTVQTVFDIELRRNRNIEPGNGTRSLGTIKPKFIHECTYKTIVRDGIEKHDYRLSFAHDTEGFFAAIKINDLAVQNYADYLRVRRGLTHDEVGAKMTAIFKRGNVWLRLGLTRPFEGWCWLQVTGIYTFPDYLEGKCFADFRI